MKYTLALILLCFHCFAHSLSCEKVDFKINDYNGLLAIKGYVADRENLGLVKKRLLGGYCANRTKCSVEEEVDAEEFYRLYTLVQEDISIFVTSSYTQVLRHGVVIDIAEASFPELDVGEEYIFFISPYDKDAELYRYNPCAVVPVSKSPNAEQYFFNQSPAAILNALED
jgi:hypothetical protein